MRAADLIGQLGDPHYLRKANALYYEFEEVGMNKQLGYASSSRPAHELSALNSESRTFRAELDITPCGPQR